MRFNGKTAQINTEYLQNFQPSDLPTFQPSNISTFQPLNFCKGVDDWINPLLQG